MSKSIHAICLKCNHEFLFKTRAKRPRPHCPKCNHWFYIPKDDTQNTQKEKIIKKVQGYSSSNNDTQDPIDDNWFEMDDPELSRHTYREVLLSNKSTVRERLEAASKLVDLKYKSGTLDVKTQSEREVIDKFRQHDTQTLVQLLKKSSQKELS